MGIRPDNIIARTGPGVRLGMVMCALVWIAACGGGDEAETLIARVGETELTSQDVALFMQQTGRAATLEEVSKAVDQLVSIELVKQRANEVHVVTPAESLQIREWEEILLTNQFREDVIWEGMGVDEARLREWYDENVTEEVSARHILVSVDSEATEGERQAARAKADSLHQLIEAGADFGELAVEHSDDTGSGQRGGSLGYFGRGAMVAPFERAAFATDVGSVTPVIETQFGFHVILVEDRRKRSFSELREQIEAQVMGPDRTQAEQAYATRLMEGSGVEFHEENVSRLLALFAEEPARLPTAEERGLALARFEGGQITVEDVWFRYERLPPPNRRQIESMDLPQMVQALSSLVRQQLLMIEVDKQAVVLDSLRQGQLDARIGQLMVEGHLREVAEARLVVDDEAIQTYYDEHLEFYRGQTLDQVREQVREVLVSQRVQAMSAPDAQLAMIDAVADSQAQRVEVEKNEEAYATALVALQSLYEETLGRPQPPPRSPIPRPEEVAPRPNETAE